VSKVRVYELAKETGLPNKEVIRRLAELGVEAKSHSSTVEAGNAKTFRDSLGKMREERQRQQEERARAEAEEYDLAAVQATPKEATARRILPPHLRRQQEEAAAAKAAGAAPAPPADPTVPAVPAGR
jgi:translation initiation factor IF-2